MRDDLDDETFKRLHSRAKFVARKYWHSDEAEDAAQEILLSYLKNPESKQTIDQGVIDWIRQNGGRTRGGAYRICLLDSQHCLPEENLRSLSANTGSIGTMLSGFERYLDMLKKEDRCISVLIYVWGLTQREVGHCLGVSESRICQRLKGIQKKIRFSVAREEQEEIHGISEKSTEEEKVKSEGTEERVTKLEEILRAEEERFTRLSRRSGEGMEKEEPRQVEENHEARFPEWFA